MLPRITIALFSLCFILTIPSSGRDTRDLFGRAPRMTAVQVALDPRDPARIRVGALTYLGGLRLDGSDLAFGGFSSMTVVGDRFTLLSDGGVWVRFRMGRDLKPFAVQFGDLPGGPKTGYSKSQRDSESMTRDPMSGKTWVGFEKFNAIWRYDDALVRAETQVAPVGMRDWSIAGGAESMVRLDDGSFIVISETSRPRGGRGRKALRFPGDPTLPGIQPYDFVYVPPSGYDPSDAVQLPDGRLIVLNRRFSIPDLFTAKLTLVDTRAIRPGATVEGREIAALGPPLVHDNYEALAVTREGADTILWIASDNNQARWEQSLLLKFRIEFAKR